MALPALAKGSIWIPGSCVNIEASLMLTVKRLSSHRQLQLPENHIDLSQIWRDDPNLLAAFGCH